MWLRSYSLIVLTTVAAMAQPPDVDPVVSAPQKSGRAESDERTSGADNNFVPLSTERIQNILNSTSDADTISDVPVRSLNVSAVYTGSGSISGTMRMIFNSDVLNSRACQFVTLGRTNLQDLKLVSGGQPVSVAAQPDGDIVALSQLASNEASATWTKAGTQVGTSNIFQFELPPASVCEFNLRTDRNTIVTSPDAFVIADSPDSVTTLWKIRPDNPARLTVSCTRQIENDSSSVLGLNVSTDVQVNSSEATVAWTVTVAPSPSSRIVNLHITRPCRIVSVTNSDDTVPSWKSDKKDMTVSVTVPSGDTQAGFRIRAAFAVTDSEQIDLPLLAPVSWQTPDSSAESPAALRSSAIRVSIAPTVLIRSVALNGVYERDVAWSADGTQTIELTQFAGIAEAALYPAPSRPVIDDSVAVVFDPESDAGTAMAYVSVVARTGRSGQVQWTIPASWRVTEVRELESGFPLLFQVREHEPPTRETQLHVYLRTPVTRASEQSLAIRLQSTASGGNSYSELPALTSPGYQRQFDYIVTHDDDVILGESAILTSDELLSQAEWLPQKIFKDIRIFRRVSRSVKPRLSASAADDVFSTIDYSARRNGDMLRESVRIRLRCRNGLPQIIPLTVTEGVDITVSDESATHPPPLLVRMRGENRNWRLELPPGTEQTDEIDVLLVTERKLQSQMPATVVVVAGARQTGGSIQPPSADDGLVMDIPGVTEPTDETVAYPAAPPRSMKLRQLTDDSFHQKVSGTVFQILNRSDNDTFHIEGLARLYVESFNGASSLALTLPHTAQLSAYVNGQPAHPERNNQAVQLPLDDDVSTNTVDLLFTLNSGTAATDDIQIPVLQCSGIDTQYVTSFVMLPEAMQVSQGKSVGLETRTPAGMSAVFAAAYTDPVRKSLADVVVPFQLRWNVAASRSATALIIDPSVADTTVSVRVQDSTFDSVRQILYLMVFAMAWFWLDSRIQLYLWFPGLCLTVSAAAHYAALPERYEWLTGFLWGTLIWAGCRLAKRIPVRAVSGQPPSRHVRAVSTVASIAVIVFWMSGLIADERPRTADVVQVERGQSVGSDSSLIEEALIVDCSVKITLESPQTASAVVDCLVATAPDKASRLMIPLQSVTLIESSVEGNPVLPRRDSAGRTQLIIPGESLLPSMVLDNESNTPFSAGPSVLDGWLLRKVSYTIRLVPRRSAGLHKISIPHPPSPRTQISLSDPSQLVDEAGIEGRPMHSAGVVSGIVDFPVVFGTKSADVSLRLKNALTPENNIQKSSVACEAEVTTTQVRLRAFYRVTPPDQQTDSVRIGIAGQYRILSVQSADGDPLEWSTDSDSIVVRAAPDSQGVQQVVVRQIIDSPVSLDHRIYVDRLRQINELAADEVTLAVRTTDRFVIHSLTYISSSATSNSERQAAAIPDSQQVTATDLDVVLSPEVSVVRAVLAERASNREAQLQQRVVVDDEQIRWTCECRLDISGQPIYRQQIQVPDSVRISTVSATSDGASRLQSWTRSNDLVVVALREATRGLLDLQLDGTVIRHQEADTSLPEVSLPGVQILESDIELSAAPQTDAFIRSLGSTVPNAAIDIETETIPTTPLRLSVQDESDPVVIRARPEQQLVADVAILIYEIGEQPLLAQILALRMPHSSFDIRFSLVNDGYPAVSPTARRNGEPVEIGSEGNDYVISRPDRRDRDVPTLLMISDVIPLDGMRILPVSLPVFDAKIEIAEHRLFDLRPGQTSGRVQDLPSWLANAAKASGITEDTRGVESSAYTFDAANDRFQLEPIQSTDSESLQTNRVVVAVGAHVVRTSDRNGVSGHSDLLLCSSDRNPVSRLLVPSGVLITELAVNGRPQTIIRDGEVVDVSATDRVDHVAVEWVQTSSSTRTTQIRVPRVAEAAADDLAIVVTPSGQRPMWWKVDGTVLTEAEFVTRNSAALRTALRIVNPGFRAASDSGASGPGPGPGPEPELTDVFWQQVASESPDAATSFRMAVDHQEDLIAGPAVLLLTDNNTITIESPILPSFYEVLAVLTGIVMIAGPVVARRRRVRTLAEVPDGRISVHGLQSDSSDSSQNSSDTILH